MRKTPKNADLYKIPDVIPGSQRAPIDVLHGKKSPVRVPLTNIPNLGLFCQTDGFIVPPKLSKILRFRECRD